jgi:hypothetical protein
MDGDCGTCLNRNASPNLIGPYVSYIGKTEQSQKMRRVLHVERTGVEKSTYRFDKEK